MTHIKPTPSGTLWSQPPSQPAKPAFGGSTFNPARDGERLGRQLDRVRECMSDGQWRTLAEISAATGAPEASVSARLRDLRKPHNGGYVVDEEFVERGLHRYRVSRGERGE